MEQQTGKRSFGERAGNLGRAIWKHRAIYTLLIPGLVWYAIFAYMPMGGLSLAFKQYKANLGIWGSPWIGFGNYEFVFRDAAFWRAMWKTITINMGRMIFQFPAPIILALLLNEFRMKRYKRVLQTVYTFPHFLSWVIVASIATNVLSLDGMINQVVTAFGGEPISFLGDPTAFIPILYITDIWKYAGYGSIIYLAAISGIDMDQYEAADIDGASRTQKLMHITIPSILPTIIIMFIMTTGQIMSMGFDQIFNMSNAAVKQSVEVLDMYIYRITFQSATDFSFSTAVSLFRSVLNMAFLVLADRGSKLLGGGGLFG
ncbi:ABC transporter permease [Acutalibacter muris]|uniref:ABC transporter permease n=1 Tax=Acutalibacter muris TaxID=1796620 RepID=UPI00272C0890|nr:ABC transporter permease subunit [Acutalibacter muris]